MRKVWALLPVVAAITLAGCGSLDRTADVKVTVAGRSDRVEDGRSGQERCLYFDGWLNSGDQVFLRDAEGKVLGSSELRATDSFRDGPSGSGGAAVVCSWEAILEGVPVNRLAYTVGIADFGEVVVSRDGVEQGELSLRPRSAMAVLAGEGVLVEVDAGR